jgi:ubiquitin carboxyl-terminal hydrolase 34
VSSPNSAVEEASPIVARFRDFFWPLISRLVKPAIASPGNSAEILELCFDMLQTLDEAESTIVNLKQLSNEWFGLLLSYTTSEVCWKLARLPMARV